MKKYFQKVLPIVTGSLLATVLILLIFANISGKTASGSTPIKTGTESFSVDVCINQDCEYVADGQNDEIEIQQAIDAVLAVGGGRVNIRNGDYSIAAPINISLSGESLIIEGDGIDTKLTNAMTDASLLGSMFNITGQAASLLATTTGVSTATSTGSLGTGTYYFKLTTSNDTGARSQASAEVSCSITKDASCIITWTDATGDESTRIWVSNTSGSYFEYFNATTTGQYTFATSTNGLLTPTNTASATSTAGTLSEGTYYFRITAINDDGSETLATTEDDSCYVGIELSATSTHCQITWTNSVNASSTGHRIWVSRFSGNYTSYFMATSSEEYSLATSTSPTTGTFPTANTTSLVTDPISGTLSIISLDSFTMKNLYLVGNSTGGRGLIITDINKTKILSSKFTDFTSSATWGIGIYASSSGQTLIFDNVFKDNTEDIELAGKTKNSYITNNQFNDSGEITLGSGTDNISIDNNSNLITITDNGSANLIITNAGALSVNTLTQGGGENSTTTPASMTLAYADFDTENFIDMTPTIGNITITLPATSTMSEMIPKTGDMREIILRNATTTAATTITIAAGTGIDLQLLETTGADLVLEGLDVATLQFIRKADTDILVLWKEYIEAD